MEIMLAAVIIIFLSIFLLYFGNRFKIPSIVIFLIIGILVGPFGLAVIQDEANIAMIGQLGIILLLFTIGLEFSFEKLLGAWKAIIIGGVIQVCTTIAAIAAITYWLGWEFNVAVFFGFLVSLSSTAIVMKVLQERGEIETLSGRTMLGILIFQDLAIIPMILITPLLLGTSNPSTGSLPLQVFKVAVILLIIVISAHWLVPAFLYRVARQRSRELFFITVAGICLIVAWLTSAAGLSVTLGAFVAGLIIGESDYSIDALSNIMPFRDVFAAIFFISIGMMLDTRVLATNIPIVTTVVLTIIGVKFLTGSFSAFALGLPARVTVFTGLALFQIGEFSFILAETGRSSSIIPDITYQIFLAAAIVTMALTPFSIRGAPGIMEGLYRIFPYRLSSLKRSENDPDEDKTKFTDHIIIAGFGITGKGVGRAAEIAGIPYNIIELNPDIVRQERNSHKLDVIFGDATNPEVLRHAGIHNARALVIAISERGAVPRIVHSARDLSPSLYIITRSRYMDDVDYLLEMGANEVIPEEFEISIGLFSRVLANYGIDDTEIEKVSQRIRSRGYHLFTRAAEPEQSLTDLKLRYAETRVHTLRVGQTPGVVGKTLADLDINNRFGVTLLAFRRQTATTTIPPPDTTLEPGDELIILASEEHLEELSDFLLGEAVPGPGLREATQK
jgi:monovalent cation:H+ antiporter-2, CPA2 family